MPESTSQPPPPIDPAALVQLRRMTEREPARYVELLESFLETAAQSVGQMQGTGPAADLDIVYRAAHTLKPLCTLFGARILHHLCRRIESLAREGQGSEMAAAVREVAAEHRRVHQALTAEIRRAAGSP